jgi:hypothetical protein
MSPALLTFVFVSEPVDAMLDDLTTEAAVLRVYRQAFAVLAREAGAMILDVDLIDVDEAILEAFAAAGSDGLTVAEVVAACHRFDARVVERRLGVLRDYQAISKVVDRPNEQHFRAAFAPYIMLLFLHRLAERGGQSELHQLLTLERLNVSHHDAVEGDGRASVSRLTKVFRLLANELTSLVQRGAAEALRENAQLLWGNRSLIVQAEEVHAVVLGRWPSLGQQCAALRISLAAYGDAIEAAAGRLIEQAGTTRALGFLPAETWVSFARRSDVQALAAVLDSFVFDAPAPWLSPQALAEAVESARPAGGTRFRPPRPDDRQDLAEQDLMPVDDTAELRIAAERLLGDRGSVSVAELLDEAGDWPTGRRLVAEMIAIHHHPDLSFELRWGDGLRIDPGSFPSWVSDGWFGRLAKVSQ